eukprot:Lithocolla_globosa_v1_NODE_5785_length_1184_cov_15.126661.p1 type:complete len:331 gc:universal NODE_5785_length_1184_cov_15.126661:1140-148(-)
MLNKIKSYFPKHKKNDVLNKYTIGKKLGAGNFSIVKRCTEKSTGKEYALKIIDKKTLEGKEEMIDTETDILCKVKHKNIISLKEHFDTPEKLYLVMDLATGGELFERIVSKGSYTEKDASKLVRNIVEAIEYLHSMDVVHRDLKPENLLFADESEEANVMVSDFGLSKLMNEQTALTTACGTPGYVAPEVLRQKGYGKEVDMWSVGVITYILLCGYPPFYDEDQATLFEMIIGGKYDFHKDYWSDISDSAKDLIKKLLTVDPRNRLTATGALAHPWISGGEAKNTDIHGNYKTGFQKFNARRKFVGAVRTVITVNRMGGGFGESASQDEA